MSRLIYIALFLALVAFATAETKLPAPTRHFNDLAGVVSPEVATDLETRLVELEKNDSTQFVVYIYPKLDTESSMEDYTQRTAQNWGIGQKGKNNGLILFLFAKDSEGYKRIRFEVGYGLEGVMPDATAKLIIEREIVPALKASDWNAAVSKGVISSIAAIKGEYKAPAKKDGGVTLFWILVIGVGSIWLICFICSPRGTLSITGDILDVVVSSGSKSSRGGSGGSWGGGGGSFGGGGASGRA